jgi:hypothetical protein
MVKADALRRAPVAALTLLLATGCDPVSGILATGTMRPAPVRDCVTASLNASPLVSGVVPVPASRDDQREGSLHAYVTFRDVRSDNDTGNFTEQAKGDSVAILTVEFLWLGVIGGVPRDERARMATAATSLLAALKAACAPGSTGDVECRVFGLGSDHTCTLSMR